MSFPRVTSLRPKMGAPQINNVLAYAGVPIPSGKIKQFDGTTWSFRSIKNSSGAVYKMKRFNGSIWVTLP